MENKYKAKVPTGSTSNYVAGLYSKDGRLINARPDSESGIDKAASIKKEIKKARKISMIADGIELAEMRKNIREDFF